MLSILVAHSYFLRFDEKQRQRAKPYPPLATITRAARLQTDESVRLLKELGCYRIWIGSESGSQKILDAVPNAVAVNAVS